jgi:hypothetical protein
LRKAIEEDISLCCARAATPQREWNASVGGELIGKPLIAAKDFAAITKNAIDFVALVQEAKRK